MAQIHNLPGAFPLHEDRDFLSEREWVILKLLCRTTSSLATAEANELSRASGGQLTPERCRQLINIARIASLPGLGTWIARLMSEAHLDAESVRRLPAEVIARRINTHAGYPVCNAATMRALARLQSMWAADTEADGS